LKKKLDEEPTNLLYCYIKECDFKFVIKMLTIKKTSKVLEFNILQ